MRSISILCASALTAVMPLIAVNCDHPPDPAIDVVKAIATSGQSCTVGDRFYTRYDGSTLCLEDEYVMSSGG